MLLDTAFLAYRGCSKECFALAKHSFFISLRSDFLAVMWHDAVIFLTIPDAFSKVIFVGGSTIPWYTEEGVRVIGVLDFLLDPERVLLHMY